MTTRTRHLIKEEEAVSPVIGVILMVAITVILAAVIGAFVFGMGGSLKKTYTVGATATQVGATTVDVTFQGGPDAGLVDYMNVTIDGTAFGRDVITNSTASPDDLTCPTFGSAMADEPDGAAVAVGTAITLSDTGATKVISTARDHVVVTATFMDGTKQIVLDTYV